MASHEVIVVGGGISGLCFAREAQRAGRGVLVLEAEDRPGGSLHTERTGEGFWLELGAHTCYNSYATLIDHLEELGLLGELQARGKPRLCFLDGDDVAPGANLGALLRRMNKWQLLGSLPRLIGASQEGRTVAEYYGAVVGRDNYARVLGPMLSAVPSQRADEFPADMLFKKRARRKDILRSFTLKGGLSSFTEAVGRLSGIELRTGSRVRRVMRQGAAYEVELADGQREKAEVLALAMPPVACAKLLGEIAPTIAETIAPLGEAELHTTGVVVKAGRVEPIPYATFLIPLGDIFHSIVTRDVVPDDRYRGFAFHFHPGLSEEQRLSRVEAVLKVPRRDLELVTERDAVLPSPRLGHHEVTRRVDELLTGGRLAITGNWFGGLAIEDCALRSRAEWQRVAAEPRAS